MNLFESIKKPFLKRTDVEKEYKNLSSTPDPRRIDTFDLEDRSPLGFFDGFSDGLADNFNYFGDQSTLDRTLNIQKNWLANYRRIQRIPEVAQAISEIVDEALFSQSGECSFSLDIQSEVPKAIEDKIREEFDALLAKMNISKNLYYLFEKFYVDGQLVLHLTYNIKGKQQAQGIQTIKVLNPANLYFDVKNNKWRYKDILDGTDNNVLFSAFSDYKDKYDQEFDLEEIIRIDSGIYEGRVILSDLHQAVKVANNLQTLEEMLVPMRFSRSVSRRVFNVDVANMNSKKAEEYLRSIQTKFKYKKFYDLESGQISNQQHVASLTEDYWFPNRGGVKGTTVDTIDETGNLGETGDLEYFRKKLYIALKVPLGRLGLDDKAEFDFTSTSVSREELKFFNFVSRKRIQFSDILIQLLRRQLISKKIVTDKEFDELKNDFKIVWNSMNKFYEKMQDEQLTQSISMFRELEELSQKGWVSKEFLYKKVLKLSQEEIEEMQKQIKSEKSDKIYKNIKVGDPMEQEYGDDGGYQNNTADDEENEVEDEPTKEIDDEDKEDTEEK